MAFTFARMVNAQRNANVRRRPQTGVVRRTRFGLSATCVVLALAVSVTANIPSANAKGGAPALPPLGAIPVQGTTSAVSVPIPPPLPVPRVASTTHGFTITGFIQDAAVSDGAPGSPDSNCRDLPASQQGGTQRDAPGKQAVAFDLFAQEQPDDGNDRPHKGDGQSRFAVGEPDALRARAGEVRRRDFEAGAVGSGCGRGGAHIWF